VSRLPLHWPPPVNGVWVPPTSILTVALYAARQHNPVLCIFRLPVMVFIAHNPTIIITPYQKIINRSNNQVIIGKERGGIPDTEIKLLSLPLVKLPRMIRTLYKPSDQPHNHVTFKEINMKRGRTTYQGWLRHYWN
jgi:hypothetical protein